MKGLSKRLVLGVCRFLENVFWGLGDFFECWGDHFDDNLQARLRRVLAEFNRGRRSGIEICPYCDTILSDQEKEEMGFLPDYKIKEWAEAGGVSPLDHANINPASLDLRLGNIIRVPRWYWRNPVSRWAAWYLLGQPDPRHEPDLYWAKGFEFKRFTLWPGRSVLCDSLEYTILPDDCIAFLLGKSTMGRMFLEQLHAGYGDPGFGSKKPDEMGDDRGDTWTFELVNLARWPIELVAGERLLQLVLGRLEDLPHKTYRDTGRYRGQSGPTPARPALKAETTWRR